MSLLLAAGAANAFTLPAAAGTYTLTGNTATFDVAMPAAQGAYALTGVSQTFGVAMPAASGAYALSGQAANFAVVMPAAQGAYAITGIAQTFDVKLPATAGVYALNGNAATLLHNSILDAVRGQYTLTGMAATPAITMPAAKGAHIVTGRSATLIWSGESTSVVRRRALNVAPFAYYGRPRPFLNIAKSADPRWRNGGTFQEYPTHPYMNAAGALIGLPNGVATQNKIFYSSEVNAEQYAYIRSGTYVLKWQGGATATPVGDVSSVSSITESGGVKRRTFVVSSTQPGTLSIDVTNTSGVAADFTDCAILYGDDEASHDAGDIFEPNFLAKLVGAKVIRFMDWMQCNNFGFSPSSTQTDFADLHTEGDVTYAHPSASGREGIPPSIIGKLGIKRGVDIWVCTPAKATDTCLSAIAQAIFDTGFAGNVYVEAGNEWWNTSFPVRAWARDTKAATINVVNAAGAPSTSDTDKVACAMAECAAAAWTAFEAVFGTDRVRRVIGTQAATTGHGAFYQHTVQLGAALAAYGSTQIKTLINNANGRVAIAPYFQNQGSSDTATKVYYCENEVYNLPDSAFITDMEGYIDAILVWVTDHQAYMAARAPNCTLTTYECGQHVTVADYEPASMYSVTIDDVNDKLVSATSLTAGWRNGEYAYLSFQLFTALGISTRTPLVKLSGTTGLRLFVSQAAYDADSAFNMAPDGNTYVIDPILRMLFVDQKFKTIFNGVSGRTLYEYYHKKIFENRLELFNHYTDIGIHTNSEQWGLDRSQWDADTPRATWFRSSGRQRTLIGVGQ